VDADPVAAVELLHRCEPLVADDGLRDEQLQLGAALGDRGEHELAGVALEHDAPGDADLVGCLGTRIEVGPVGSDLGERVRAVEAVGVRLAADGPDGIDLPLTADPLGGEPAAGERAGCVGRLVDHRGDGTAWVQARPRSIAAI
jgi:hypothetical protein